MCARMSGEDGRELRTVNLEWMLNCELEQRNVLRMWHDAFRGAACARAALLLRLLLDAVPLSGVALSLHGRTAASEWGMSKSMISRD